VPLHVVPGWDDRRGATCNPAVFHVKLFLGAALLVTPLVVPATAVAVPSAAVSAEECAEVTSARVPKWAQGLKEPAQVGPEKVVRRVSGGNVPDQWITRQMNVLNASFSGATGGAPTVFQFQLAG
jgi:hypothetical protein